jgi:phenylacetate-CoA ligase
MAVRHPAPGELDAIETASRDEIAALQLTRLKSTLRHVYAHVPHYRAAFDAQGVHPDDLKQLSDLAQFPFTVKSDLRENYPFGLFAVPREQVVRLHASSGTTGKPTVVGYTRNDIANWADLVARSIRAAGGRAGDIVQIAYGYGLFTGGLGAHYGAEPWTEAMRREIESKAGIDAVDIYGLSEVMGPGVASECIETKDGPVIWEDHFYPEIVDPDTGQVLPEGSEGELVFTSLTKEALPIIRYRTRDLTRLLAPTARAFRRMGKIVGRSDDMLIIRGVNVFPTQIEEIVLAHGQLSGQYQLLVSRDGLLDQVEVHCELQPGAQGMDSQQQQEIAGWVKQRVKTLVGITTSVSVLPPDSIERTLTGKARRVVDKRPKK